MHPIPFQQQVDELGRTRLLPSLRQTLGVMEGDIFALELDTIKQQVKLTGIPPEHRLRFPYTTRVDPYGRIMIPLSFLFTLEIERNDTCAQILEQTGICLKKTRPRCRICGAQKSLHYYRQFYICSACISNLKQL